MVPVIRIDEEVYRWLQAQARPFEDNPNSVLKRIKAQQSNVALQNEKAELLKHIHSNVKVELTEAQEAELEALKFSDPEAWRSKINAYEAQAQAKYAKEVDEKLTAVSAEGTEIAKQNTGGHSEGTPLREFREPILQVLKSLHNIASRAVVLKKLEELLKDELTPHDKSTDKYDRATWKNNVDDVIGTMRKEGILKPKNETERGAWSLTEYGQELAESD